MYLNDEELGLWITGEGFGRLWGKPGGAVVRPRREVSSYCTVFSHKFWNNCVSVVNLEARPLFSDTARPVKRRHVTFMHLYLNIHSCLRDLELDSHPDPPQGVNACTCGHLRRFGKQPPANGICEDICEDLY